MTTVAQQLQPLRAELQRARVVHGRRSTAALRAWEDLFRTAARLGQPLDALSRHSRDEDERFFAQTLPGPDGHVYWDGGKVFTRNDKRERSPRRWWWARSRGAEPHSHDDVVPICGDAQCINPEHCEAVRRERKRLFTEEAIIGAIQVMGLRLGRGPTRTDWTRLNGRPDFKIIRARFGTWSAALRAAGYEPKSGSKFQVQWDEESAVEALRFVGARLGRAPSTHDFSKMKDELHAAGLPASRMTIRKLCGEWPEALEKAGLAA